MPTAIIAALVLGRGNDFIRAFMLVTLDVAMEAARISYG